MKLTDEVKYNIYPNGNPFGFINIPNFHTFSPDRIKFYSIKLIENMIKYGNNHDSKCLGAYYVLGALTLVSDPAAIALPWLYQSVS